MMFRINVVFGALVLTSCSDFPKDPEATLERVRSEHVFRVGIVEPSASMGSDRSVQSMLHAIGREVHASHQIIKGDAETLLTGLEEGRLELVIGYFEIKSPWTERVTLAPALRHQEEGESEFQLAPAMRNGENGWIALVERQARDAAMQAR
jgi:hypothetical protein